MIDRWDDEGGALGGAAGTAGRTALRPWSMPRCGCRWFYELVRAYGLWVLFIKITLECMGIRVPGETVLVSAALYAGSTHRLTINSVMLVAATAGGMAA